MWEGLLTELELGGSAEGEAQEGGGLGELHGAWGILRCEGRCGEDVGC